MKIVIVGHHRMTELVRRTLARLHPAIETDVLLMETEDTAPLASAIPAVEAGADGLLFTGRYPYDLLNNAVLSHKPWAYVRRDAAQLLAALLRGNRLHGWDPARVSIDSYSGGEVRALCRQTGLPEDGPAVWDRHVGQPNFLSDLTRFHRRNVTARRADFCVTGISSVYDALQAAHVPCIILDPTEESIRDAVRLLLLKRDTRRADERGIVVLAIEQDLPDEHALIRENEYQLALESMGVTEAVYLFAQRIQAAVVEREMGRFLLFTTRSLLEAETEGLRTFPLLTGATGMRFGHPSIGIGYGETAREAKYNANLGLLKAKRAGGACTFLVLGAAQMVPLAPASDQTGKRDMPSRTLDGRFQQVARQAGVSPATVMRLQGVMDFEQRDTFTPGELAALCRMTVRSANRLLEKLLQTGFAQVVGSQARDGAGRPSRVVRIDLSVAP